MTKHEAFDLLLEVQDKNYFYVIVGRCKDKELSELSFWQALEELDHCIELGMEEREDSFPYIYSPRRDVKCALDMFNLGKYRRDG